MNALKAYNRQDARELLPLLRVIAREIEERRQRINEIEGMVEALSVSRRAHGDEIANLQAELAEQRREMRYTLKEVEALGCAVDDSDPVTIRIPGRGGDLRQGFAWRPGESALRFYSAETESAA